MKAIRLRTEYCTNPIGLDRQRPRLQWNAEGGVRQTAYQIVAGRWDTGKACYSALHAWYPCDLASRERVCWKIRLWDENGQPGEWTEGFFEMGLLNSDDWQAKWIAGHGGKFHMLSAPADCFRKVFRLSGKVEKARLYIACLGQYEARLNGQTVGGASRIPGYSGNRKCVRYQTYDVTDMLDAGEQALTVTLANGLHPAASRLLAQLEITYTNGKQDTVSTDATWDWSNDGSIRKAGGRTGLTVDAARVPSFSGKAKEAPLPLPTASDNLQIKEQRHFRPTATKLPNGKTLLDFGLCVSGILSFRANARAGQKLIFRLAERLDAGGDCRRKNPSGQIVYLCKEGQNEYKAAFALCRFRYVEVAGDAELLPEETEAIACSPDLEQTSFIDSADASLRHAMEDAVLSVQGSLLPIPVPSPFCGSRGRTDDALARFDAAGMLFDAAAFFRNAIRDLHDSYAKDGELLLYVPDGGLPRAKHARRAWTDAGILLTYRDWKLYHDSQLLRETYYAMARHARYLEKRTPSLTPRVRAEERARLFDQMREMADALGYAKDAKEFQAAAARWKRAGHTPFPALPEDEWPGFPQMNARLFSLLRCLRVSGENRFSLTLRPDDALPCAEIRRLTVYGEVLYGWKRENGKNVYHISVPADCKAKVLLPGGKRRILRAGDYAFEERN